MSSATQFINCRQCFNGDLVCRPLTIDSTGRIIPNSPLPANTQTFDLEGSIISPGFIELQINGALGFHFAHFSDTTIYQENVKKLAKYLPETGVTAFYPTVPTVSAKVLTDVLPFLRPSELVGSASILGAHVEGPFLSPSKRGAHNETLLQLPISESLEALYGRNNLEDSIRLLTLAPELRGALSHIQTLTKEYNIRVSMGHSNATYEESKAGLEAGANLITHTFNAMQPLHHREPGLAGLISDLAPPYFSLIADAIHIHPRVIALGYRSSPRHCILITDSIELAGLPDGVYPGHAQIPSNQVKKGNKVTIENTDTLIGTCIGLDECVKNLMCWANLRVEEAVLCVTENVAQAMGLTDRGKLDIGRRGDFVVLSNDGRVKETWILGKKVHGS